MKNPTAYIHDEDHAKSVIYYDDINDDLGLRSPVISSEPFLSDENCYLCRSMRPKQWITHPLLLGSETIFSKNKVGTHNEMLASDISRPALPIDALLGACTLTFPTNSTSKCVRPRGCLTLRGIRNTVPAARRVSRRVQRKWWTARCPAILLGRPV